MASQLNIHNYQIVVDADNKLIMEGENVLLQSITDNSVVYLPYSEASKIYELETLAETCTEQSNSMDTILQPVSSDTRQPWTRVHILKLIDMYKKYENDFKSSSIKNNRVWDDISTQMKTHNSEQCKNKFKYLKQKYHEKKDNMSTKSSGMRAINFEYFAEFDEIFGKKPNVTPVAIASSSRGVENVNKIRAMQDTVENETPKKKQKCELQKQITDFNETVINREEARERRHQDRMKIQREILETLQEIRDHLNHSTKTNNGF